MMLWIMFTVMTSVAAVLVSAPVIRRLGRLPAATVGDEIETHGPITGRAGETGIPRLSAAERNFTTIGIITLLALGSAGLYVATATDDPNVVPDTRQSASVALAHDLSALEDFAATEPASDFDVEAQAQPSRSLPPVEEMIRRLADRLTRNPDDTDGWRTLGWSYLSTGRFREAAEAYGKAIARNPDMVEFRAARIEALVGSADGVVGPDAQSAIAETLKRDPKNIRARFYKGLAEEQAGDRSAALADWTALMKDADPGEPLVAELESKIDALRRDIGAPAASRPAAPLPATRELGLNQ